MKVGAGRLAVSITERLPVDAECGSIISAIIAGIMVKLLEDVFDDFCGEPAKDAADLRSRISRRPLKRRLQQKRINLALRDYDDELYGDIGSDFGEAVLATFEDEASEQDVNHLMVTARFIEGGGIDDSKGN